MLLDDGEGNEEELINTIVDETERIEADNGQDIDYAELKLASVSKNKKTN